MRVLLLLLISRIINRSGLRISHSKVFISGCFIWISSLLEDLIFCWNPFSSVYPKRWKVFFCLNFGCCLFLQYFGSESEALVARKMLIEILISKDVYCFCLGYIPASVWTRSRHMVPGYNGNRDGRRGTTVL